MGEEEEAQEESQKTLKALFAFNSFPTRDRIFIKSSYNLMQIQGEEEYFRGQVGKRKQVITVI